MRNIPWSARTSLLAGVAAALLSPVPSSALVLQTTGPSGPSSLAALKNTAAILRERWAADPASLGASGELNGIGYRIVPGHVVPRGFAGAPGRSTYIWSDTTFRFESGFDFKAGSLVFGKKPAVESQEAPQSKAPSPTQAWTTQLRKASLGGTRLRIDYSMAQAGPVSIQVFGTDGKTLARWNWRENAAGRYVKTMDGRSLAGHGALFLRWTDGQNRAVQKISVTK